MSKSRLKGQNDILQEEILRLQNVNRSLRNDIHRLHNEIAYNSKLHKVNYLRARMILDKDMPIDFVKEKLSYMLANEILKSDFVNIDINDDTNNCYRKPVITMDVGVVERR